MKFVSLLVATVSIVSCLPQQSQAEYDALPYCDEVAQNEPVATASGYAEATSTAASAAASQTAYVEIQSSSVSVQHSVAAIVGASVLTFIL